MTADLDECVLRLDSYGLVIPSWTQYVFSSEFLTACDGFSFSIGDPGLPQTLPNGYSDTIPEIREGLRVGLQINGNTICTGYIDEVHYESSHDGGTVMTVSGKDVLGDSMYSIIDPLRVFQPTQTLAQIITDVMGDFGFPNEPLVDNAANRDLISGNKYGHKNNKARVSKRGKVSGSGINKDFLNHQAKPRDMEGAYDFCERLAKRQGLHIWATGDGVDLVVGAPDFAQQARYKLTRKRGALGGAHNNVLGGSVTKSRKNQPSVIIAAATSGGGNFSLANNKVIMVNWTSGLDAKGALVPGLQRLIEKYPKAYVIGLDDVPNKTYPYALSPHPRVRPLYLRDSEAQNIEELKNFVRREMAERQRGSLVVEYEVAGHSQGGVVWAVDTIVSVDDDIGNLHEDLWVEGVTFTKSVGSGTRTHLRLIRPYTLVL